MTTIERPHYFYVVEKENDLIIVEMTDEEAGNFHGREGRILDVAQKSFDDAVEIRRQLLAQRRS